MAYISDFMLFNLTHSALCVPDSILSALHVWTNLNLTKLLGGLYHHHPHLTDEETDAGG